MILYTWGASLIVTLPLLWTKLRIANTELGLARNYSKIIRDNRPRNPVLSKYASYKAPGHATEAILFFGPGPTHQKGQISQKWQSWQMKSTFVKVLVIVKAANLQEDW